MARNPDAPVLDVQKLDGWVASNEVATRIGVTRQTMHAMLGDGMFDPRDLRYIWGPIYLIRQTVAEQFIEDRLLQAKQAEERRQRLAHGPFNDDVRRWQRGRGVPSPRTRPLTREDYEAYLAAHPDVEVPEGLDIHAMT